MIDMNFYIDFEATQFSHRIISIGCINENGHTFNTLVKLPSKQDKVNSFITDLTNITNEMLSTAPDPNEAFLQFKNYIDVNNDGIQNNYYCYGNSDISFIEHTISQMSDINAIKFAKELKNSIIDYSILVSQYFNLTNRLISLNSIYTYLINVTQLELQNHNTYHNALIDATMLKVVANNLNAINIDDIEVLIQISHEQKQFKNMLLFKSKQQLKEDTLIPIPDYVTLWNGQKKWDAENTCIDKNNWKIKCKTNHHIKYFDSIDIAAHWVIHYLTSGISPKSKNEIERVKNKILNAANSEKSYYIKWYSRK